jgi:hypothetical protein
LILKNQAMHKPRLRRLESLVEIAEEQLRRGQRSLPPRQLQTAQDVIDLLQEQVEAVRHEARAGTIEKARALGYLAGIARKAIETGDLAARLELLEAVLKQRKKNNPR